MGKQQITQEQFIIDELSRENASMKVELLKAKFQIIALNQMLEANKKGPLENKSK